MEKRLEFETLLADLSARFINMPVDRIDAEIEDAQRHVCEYIGLDRASLWQRSADDPRSLTLTHLYGRMESPSPPQRMDAHEHFPWTFAQIMEGKVVIVQSVEELPAEAARDKETWRHYGTKSSVVVPLAAGGGRPVGIASFATVRKEYAWSEVVLKRLCLVAQIFGNALARKDMEEKLRVRLREIEQLKQQIEGENIYLRKEARLVSGYGEIIGSSRALTEILDQVHQVAPTDSTVLLLGETGTGKELIARAIHSQSRRKGRVMVKVDCASLPSALIESELFGRERGAYTGALTRQAGRFEIAHGSTIFLDEIAEMPLEVQAKLLRVLQDGEFERLGSPQKIRVDVRVIAATNRDLAQAVKKGAFREDLYYRLNVFPIRVPPLRERPEDIPVLVQAFVDEFSGKMGKRIRTVPGQTINELQGYGWPGNVRELRNLIEHAVIISPDGILRVRLPRETTVAPPAPLRADEMERQHIMTVLEMTKWRVKGRNGAAEILGLKPSTLYSRMMKLSIPTRRQKDQY